MIRVNLVDAYDQVDPQHNITDDGHAASKEGTHRETNLELV